MNNKEISISILNNIDSFYNLIKIVNKDRYKIDKSLTEKQFFALSELKRHNKMELKNLSTQLHVSTSSLCILLNKLVEKKYVYREEDKRDRRNTFYGITKEGLELFDEQVMKFVDVIDEKIDKEKNTSITVFQLDWGVFDFFISYGKACAGRTGLFL